MIILKDPLVLILIIILIPLILTNYILRKDSGNLRFSSLSYFKKIKQGRFVKLRHMLIGLRIFVIILLVIALARPQSGKAHSKVKTEGIDIVEMKKNIKEYEDIEEEERIKGVNETTPTPTEKE